MTNVQKLKALLLRFWKSWARELAIILSIMIPLRSSIADWNYVPTGSMKPTILEGDLVFVNKLAYDLKVPLTTWHIAQWANPERSDIIVFFSPADGKRLVKRVIGGPGDVIAMLNNRLFLNGQPAQYRFLDKDIIEGIPVRNRRAHLFAGERLDAEVYPVMITPGLPAPRSFGPVRVPEGQYFVLGDNRDNSADSRFFGFVDRKQIVGKASTILVSFNRDLPRQNRWFTKLP